MYLTLAPFAPALPNWGMIVLLPEDDSLFAFQPETRTRPSACPRLLRKWCDAAVLGARPDVNLAYPIYPIGFAATPKRTQSAYAYVATERDPSLASRKVTPKLAARLLAARSPLLMRLIPPVHPSKIFPMFLLGTPQGTRSSAC